MITVEYKNSETGQKINMELTKSEGVLTVFVDVAPPAISKDPHGISAKLIKMAEDISESQGLLRKKQSLRTVFQMELTS